MASKYVNEHQYVSTSDKKPPKLASKDLSSDWSEVYGKTEQMRNVGFQDRAQVADGTSNGNWNSATHTAKAGKKPAGL